MVFFIPPMQMPGEYFKLDHCRFLSDSSFTDDRYTACGIENGVK
jgi:hypothetical protein